MWSNFNFEVYKRKFTLKRYILLGVMVVLTAIPAISQPSNQGSFKVITELIDSGRYERAENYAKRLFNTALVKNDLVEVALWRYYLGRIMIGQKKRDEALAYLLGAHQDSTLLDHHILLDVKLKLAQLYRENNDPETATSFYEQVLGWPGQGKDDKLWLAAMIGLGELYMEAKNYHKAIDCLEKAYQRSLRLSYHDELGKVFSRLTELHFDYGSFKDSKQLAIRTLQIAYNEQLNDLTMRAYYVLGNIHFDQSNYDSALFYFRKAYAHRSDHFLKNVATLSNIAESYYELEQYDSGKLYTDRVIALMKARHPSHLYTFDLQLAKYHYSKSSRDSAYYYAIRFRDKAHNSHSHRNRRDLYKFLYQLAKKEGRLDSALLYHEIYLAEKDSVFKRIKERDLAAFRVKLETMEKQMIIDQLWARSNLDRLKLLTMISFSMLVVIASGILILYLRSKNRRKTLELNNSELKRKNIQNELGQKEKELADTTLIMVKKNQFLDELDTIIKTAKRETNGSTINTWSKLQKAVELNRSNEKEWDDFNKYFGSVHSEFFDKLKRRYPVLSPGDLRHCALIKMNMGHKESAKILGVDPNSVKMARYRMKKKLGLKETEDLGEHIHSI